MKPICTGSRRGRLQWIAGGVASIVACSWIAGCGGSPTGPGGTTVSGTVILAATLTDSVGSSLAERIVTDATGVPVELVQGDSVVATAQTRRGAFHFAGVAAGSYVVRPAVVAAPVVELPVLVHGISLQLATPLHIESAPNLRTYPNPFGRAEGLAIECTPTIAGPVDVEALTLGLQIVWHLRFAANWPPGELFHVHWIGENDAHMPVPAGLYWIRARFDGHEVADLVFLKP